MDMVKQILREYTHYDQYGYVFACGIRFCTLYSVYNAKKTNKTHKIVIVLCFN